MKKIFTILVLTFGVTAFASVWDDAIDPRDYNCEEVQMMVEEAGKIHFCSGWLGCRKVLHKPNLIDTHKYMQVAWPTLDKTFCVVGYVRNKNKP